jgi:[acyl-carrier-protein] S-malonyltransferase
MTKPELPTGPVAFVFPGQGSQFVGMGVAIASASSEARRVLDQANELLGFPLTRLMAEGPAETLEDTINAQPAILATSVAALTALKARLDELDRPLAPAFVAGHSLGEFSALVASDALSYEAALLLVRERGRLMKEAGDSAPGGMAAVLGLEDEAIAAVCDQASAPGGIVVPANRNCPGQVVISGEVEALERAMELAKNAGAKRVARLGVSIASHSPLMADANRTFNRVLDSVALSVPAIPVIGNVSATALTTVDAIDQELRQQMEHPVDWTGSVQYAIGQGVTTFVELGPGSVLSGLIRRISRDVTTLTLSGLGLGLPDSAAP